MEPDIKNLLTQKIRTEEREPVVWNKEAVWLKVSERVTTKRTNKLYFYAAAVFALLLVAVSTHHPTIMPVETVESIKIKEIKPFVRTETIPDEVVEVEKKKQEAVKIYPDHVAAKPVAGVSLQPDEEVPEVQTELTLEEPVVIAEVVPKETIQPIVGVVEWSDHHIDEEKQRRKKPFHKLEPSEKEWDGSAGSNTLLFARIK